MKNILHAVIVRRVKLYESVFTLPLVVYVGTIMSLATVKIFSIVVVQLYFLKKARSLVAL